eukprot:m.67290 g.67290  ORF g.67290 m.67290 type:complete len:412 (-) comp14101_c1_seq2:1333-2568(-)
MISLLTLCTICEEQNKNIRQNLKSYFFTESERKKINKRKPCPNFLCGSCRPQEIGGNLRKECCAQARQPSRGCGGSAILQNRQGQAVVLQELSVCQLCPLRAKGGLVVGRVLRHRPVAHRMQDHDQVVEGKRGRGVVSSLRAVAGQIHCHGRVEAALAASPAVAEMEHKRAVLQAAVLAEEHPQQLLHRLDAVELVRSRCCNRHARLKPEGHRLVLGQRDGANLARISRHKLCAGFQQLWQRRLTEAGQVHNERAPVQHNVTRADDLADLLQLLHSDSIPRRRHMTPLELLRRDECRHNLCERKRRDEALPLGQAQEHGEVRQLLHEEERRTRNLANLLLTDGRLHGREHQRRVVDGKAAVLQHQLVHEAGLLLNGLVARVAKRVNAGHLQLVLLAEPAIQPLKDGGRALG